MSTPQPPNDDLRGVLEQVWSSGRPHVERLTLAAAVIGTAFARGGQTATLVGGGALEFYVPGGYHTGDLDFVVERGSRQQVDAVLSSLGLERRNRHWARGDLFVEVPGNYMGDPVDDVQVGPFSLRVITKEALLAERIVGFRHWKYWGHGQQAIELLHRFRDSLDTERLRPMLQREGAADTFDLLLRYLDSGEAITVDALDRLWHAHYR